eukprot:5962825-Pyramimonas_sp.AAC.1
MFQLNLDPGGTPLTSKTQAQIVSRTFFVEGNPELTANMQPLMEVPISELYINDNIVINPSVQYEDTGKFRITWTTTIAGAYDVGILVSALLRQLSATSQHICDSASLSAL